MAEATAEEREEIRGTADKNKRQALIASHRENMLEAMGLMLDMGGTHLRDVLAEHIGAARRTHIRDEK